MLIGHYAPALLLQRARPTLKLWHVFVAAQLVDLAWGACVLAGIEHVRIVPGFTASNDLDLWDMPYTHGLLATLIWGLLAFVAWRTLDARPSRTGDAAVFALVVISHFVGDLLVHDGDLPLFTAQGVKLGFGLWQHKTAAVVLETALFAGAAYFWWRPHRGQKGARAAGRALVALTVLAAASFYIPTPPTPAAMAATGLSTWIACAALAAWIDRRLISSSS